MQGAPEVGGTIGAVTEQADQPVAADETATEVPAPEAAAEDAATPDDGATASEQPEPAPTATDEPPATIDEQQAPPAEDEPAVTVDEEPAPPPTDEPPAAIDEQQAPLAEDEPPASEQPEVPATEDEPPPVEQSAAQDEPAAEAQPTNTDEPAADEPAAESPAAESPAAEEPAVEEPAAESPAEVIETQPAAEGAPGDGQTAVPATGGDARAAGIGTPIRSVATTGGLNSGDIVSGVVTSVERRELELDIGSGRIGVIGSRHWAAGLDVDLTAEAKTGDTVEAAVLVREDHKQRIVLSRSWGRQQRAWESAESARKTGEIVSGVVTDAVAAGLTVDIGVRAFVPASMAGDDDLESLVGSTVECKVTEVNRLKGRCILSRKAALRTRGRQAARKRLSELSPGTKLRARVTKVEDFGALVMAEGDLRGRIRRSELSWFRVRRPSDVVAVGDEVEAVVLHTAPAKMNLDLSLRIGDDPLKAIRPGERHEATVVSLAPFGAFVTVGDGIKGLVPTAELAEHPIRHPREVVVPGDSVLAEVTKVDRQRRDLEFSVNLAVLVRPADQE